MTADGEKQRALTQVSATHPAWSPNGKQICFSSEKLAGVATPTLFAVDIDGKNVKKLTDGTLAGEDPSWAPDGKSIVYTTVEDASQMLHVIKVVGGESRQLTEPVGLDFSPAWGPTAFSVAPGSHMQLMRWSVLKRTGRANK